ncbi:hypothetical protein CAOG_009789 [Capsaspora owczarzaki ATCC 30864]|uniref:Secreted protein n=1 Tax=Capsaspora owczarzaki (strain ATCC 30864) TaxID=595528 RepID=A0A0D2WRV2_CAPO3|nr:hypothetical protein CAOG_009789 [Capsaspora owczarzaki ATCC 30864]
MAIVPCAYLSLLVLAIVLHPPRALAFFEKFATLVLRLSKGAQLTRNAPVPLTGRLGLSKNHACFMVE